MGEISRRESLVWLGGTLGLLLSTSFINKIVPIVDSVPTGFDPTPTVTPVIKSDLFDYLMKPLIEEAGRRRSFRLNSETNYSTQVDPLLNRNRVNILLYSYGETHEPPLTERAIIGSFTWFSYDYLLRKIDLVSLTHDIRAPEIERAKQARGESNIHPEKMFYAYETGGFNLTRKVLESATGLSADFQIAFGDPAIAHIVDDVFGRIEVDVPKNFEVYPYYLEGKKYPRGHFEKGRQKLDGKGVVQFIKTVPVEDADKVIEHNARKHLVFKSLLSSLQDRRGNPLFWARFAWALKNGSDNGSLSSDFDIKSLLVNNLWYVAGNIPKFISGDSSGMPEFRKTIYIVDPESGNGGVQWVKSNIAINPITRVDFEAGKYQGPVMEAMEIPYLQGFYFQANPYADDLVGKYWLPTRMTVRALIGD